MKSRTIRGIGGDRVRVWISDDGYINIDAQGPDFVWTMMTNKGALRLAAAIRKLAGKRGRRR